MSDIQFVYVLLVTIAGAWFALRITAALEVIASKARSIYIECDDDDDPADDWKRGDKSWE